MHDIAGEEDKVAALYHWHAFLSIVNIRQYTLDSHGFQIYPHAATEKDFVDDEQIKAGYYPETEQLLKDASVHEPPIVAGVLG